MKQGQIYSNFWIKYNKNIIEEKIHNLENDLLSVVVVVGLSPGQVRKAATRSPVPRHNYLVLFLLVVVSFFVFFQDGVLETALEQRRHDTNTQ